MRKFLTRDFCVSFVLLLLRCHSSTINFFLRSRRRVTFAKFQESRDWSVCCGVHHHHFQPHISVFSAVCAIVCYCVCYPIFTITVCMCVDEITGGPTFLYIFYLRGFFVQQNYPLQRAARKVSVLKNAPLP